MDEIMCCLSLVSFLSAEEDAPSRNQEFSQSSGMGNVGEHAPLTEKGLTREAGQPANESPRTHLSDEAHFHHLIHPTALPTLGKGWLRTRDTAERKGY